MSQEGNQSIKLGQLIEYNMRNVILKNHTQIKVEKLVPDTSLFVEVCINILKFYTVSYINFHTYPIEE